MCCDPPTPPLAGMSDDPPKARGLWRKAFQKAKGAKPASLLPSSTNAATKKRGLTKQVSQPRGAGGFKGMNIVRDEAIKAKAAEEAADAATAAGGGGGMRQLNKFLSLIRPGRLDTPPPADKSEKDGQSPGQRQLQKIISQRLRGLGNIAGAGAAEALGQVTPPPPKSTQVRGGGGRGRAALLA